LLTIDERRSAALLLDATGAAPVLPGQDLPVVRRAVRSRNVPGTALRYMQRLSMKHGGLGYERDSLEPMIRARRAALGDAAAGPPRVVVRVDEFPRAGGFDNAATVAEMARLHEIMCRAGVPYLMAVTPRVARNSLSPRDTASRPLRGDEVEMLSRLTEDGVTLAQHGLDHRTRYAEPRRHSELCGLGTARLADLLDEGLAILGELGIRPPVFVPPFNRFDAEQYPVLAARFAVVCGGPETVPLMGFHPTPLWRGDAVYLPAYAPFYGRAAGVGAGVRRLVEREPGTWAPLTLHLPWEARDGWSDLERLAEQMAPYVASWDDFLAAVDASRRAGAPAEPRPAAAEPTLGEQLYQ
jgi:peptidoglycan/xylan/chitin deacetylase (PgdA/CDA1 family)